MNSIATDVKEKVDIAAIIGESVKLKKSGKALMGLCPFHPHKKNTNSFAVYPDTATWRCFGQCNDGGDVFAFVMKRDGVEFAEALRIVAERAGVELKTHTSAQAQARHDYEDRLRHLLEVAVNRFHQNLPNSTAATHLKERGITGEVVSLFQLGYSQAGENDLGEFQRAGYSNADLIAAGLLVQKDDGTTYPRFRGRLMLPVRDERGRMCGFQARALDGKEPKFLNSPETVLFKKGNLLFGLHLAKTAIRKDGTAVVVEGNLDVVAAHQAGFANVVSSQGTAITEEQIKLISRYARRVVLALDGDTAGQSATLQALERVIKSETDRTAWFVATLPQGDDPDDIIRRDPAEWSALIGAAQPVTAYVVETLTAGRAAADPKDRAAAAAAVAPFIAAIPNPVERAAWQQQLAERLNIPSAALSSPAAPQPTPAPTPAPNDSAPENSPPAPAGEQPEPAGAGGEEFILSGLLKTADEAATDEAATAAVEKAIELLARLSDRAVARYAERFQKLGYGRVAYERLIRTARARAGNNSPVTVEYGQLCWVREPLVNCDIRITEEQATHDGNDQPCIFYTVEATLPNGHRLPTIRRLPAEEFETGKWLAKWGTQVVSYKAPSQRWMLARAVQERSMADVKRETVSNCTGWALQNGVRMFLTNGGAITAEGHNPDVKVDLGAEQLNPYHLPAPPDDARKSVREAIGLLGVGPLPFTAPIWCATIAAVLNDQINPRGMLWVSGRTGSRKTAYVMLCQTLYGPTFIHGHETRPPANWENSIVALENLWHPTKDVPLVIDNYKPPPDRGEALRQRKLVADTLHLLGDGGGRARGKEGGGIRKNKPPRGLIISTSELPFDGESNVRRMFTIVTSPTDINNERLTKFQASGESGLLAEAMAAYIQWRLRNWDKVNATIKVDGELRKGVAKNFGILEGRILDFTVVMMVSASVFLEFAENCGAITNAQRMKSYREIETAILHLARQQQARAEAQTPLQKFAEALQAGIETRVGLILPRTGAFVFDRGQRVFGYFEKDRDGHHLYLHMPSCVEFVTAHYAAIGQVFAVNSEVIGRDVDHARMLLSRGERSISVSKYCAGNTVNVLDIDADIFARQTGVDLWPPRLGAEGKE